MNTISWLVLFVLCLLAFLWSLYILVRVFFSLPTLFPSTQQAEKVSQPQWPENGDEWSDGEDGTNMDCGLLQAMAEEDEEINVYNEETFGMGVLMFYFSSFPRLSEMGIIILSSNRVTVLSGSAAGVLMPFELFLHRKEN